MFGDTLRSGDLRHVVPIAIGDRFIYAEHDDQQVAFVPSIELPRVRELGGGLDVVAYEELGLDELRAQGMTTRAALPHLVARACRWLGIEEAAVPAGFPVSVADFVRGWGRDAPGGPWHVREPTAREDSWRDRGYPARTAGDGGGDGSDSRRYPRGECQLRVAARDSAARSVGGRCRLRVHDRCPRSAVGLRARARLRTDRGGRTDRRRPRRARSALRGLGGHDAHVLHWRAA
jgi:hypothetical protein